MRYSITVEGKDSVFMSNFGYLISSGLSTSEAVVSGKILYLKKITKIKYIIFDL